MHRNSNITDNLNSNFLAAGIFDFGHLQHIDFQHLFSYKNALTFTGKEKDSETGFYYFGARYYDPTLSGLFLSVDPMADKYPSTSPYAYCVWNPVKLVDPDGKEVEVDINHNDKTITIRADYCVDSKYKELVSKGLDKWNDMSGLFVCDISNNDKLKGYVVQFDLKIADEDTPMTIGNWISFVDGFENENTNGTTNNNDIRIKLDNDNIINAIAHEVGHSLGLMHHNDGLTGLMEEDAGVQSGDTRILSYDIQAIINKAIRNDNRIDGAGKSYLRQEGSRKEIFGNKNNVSVRRRK